MAINPDIRDQAYQFFVEEAPDLLHLIESGLLTLNQDRSTAKVHSLMRSAHSLKGGAAGVGLEAIAVLAHRLENIFKVLYDETLGTDPVLERWLLQAYDCLRLPLMQQINTGSFDPDQALAEAEPIFSQIETLFGDALTQSDSYIPSSAEMGIDMVVSILEVDVAQGLEQLRVALDESDDELLNELQTQAEVFAGFAEILNLPNFGLIAQTIQQGLKLHPEYVRSIAQLAIQEFSRSQQEILSGNLHGGVAPSAALAYFTAAELDPTVTANLLSEHLSIIPVAQAAETEMEFRSVDLPEADLLEAEASELLAGEWDETVPEFTAPEFTAPDLTEIEPEPTWQPTTSWLSESDRSASVEPVEAADSLDPIEQVVVTEVTDEVAGQFDAARTTTKLEMLELSDLNPDHSEINFHPDHELEKSGDRESLYSIVTPEFDDGLESTRTHVEEVQPDPTGLDKTQTFAIEQFEAEEVQNDDGSVDPIGKTSNTISEILSQSINETDGNYQDELSDQEKLFDQEVHSSVTDPINELIDRSIDEVDSVLLAEPVGEPAHQSLSRSMSEIEEVLENNYSGEFIQEFIDQSSIDQSNIQSSIDRSSIDQSSNGFLEESIQELSAGVSESIFRSNLRPLFEPIPSTTQSLNPALVANLTVRVDSERLERMNNLVGELAISRSSLLLQNDQMQRVIRTLRDRFLRFQTLVSQLQAVSDQINRLDQIFTIPEPDRNIQPAETYSQLQNALAAIDSTYPAAIEFDMLEMDRYGETHTQLQAILEDLVQLEESVDDISLFARQSNQTLEQQQYKLTQLRDELVWARMLPLSEVLNRFPRILHDLSVDYEKPVQLKLTGVEVLIDRAILEKLYDPLLHLLRNAFDHGIEPADLRPSTNKPPQGQIEICAFYQGNQTVIQVRDDGRGINLASIQERLQELGWLSATQIAALSPSQLINFIFEPGFSTAAQVSQLSGRGFGLDVVRSQLQALRGTVNVTSLTGKGTTFTLTLPLTLTITQLIVCLVNSLPIALPTESVADILVPQSDQLQQFQGNHWLNWREKTIPVYPLSDLLNYSCPVPEAVASQILAAFPAPKDWAAPIVVVQREEQVFGLAIDRVLTEQELVIKPFGTAAVPPRYLYGCTILGDGSPVPVIDAIALLESFPNSPSHRFDLPDSSIDPVGQQLDSVAATATRSGQASAEITPDTVTPDTVTPDTVTPDTVTPKPIAMPIGTARPRLNFRKTQTPTVLVVDDAIMLRRTLALFLEREGFRVLQAQDGQEAIDRLQQASVQLVVCDLEMPNMNGFEFLNFRRQTPHLAEIPVMILTSRSNEKHRWLSLKLGATAYFTKPYLEQEFLSALKALLPQTPVSSDSFDAKES